MGVRVDLAKRSVAASVRDLVAPAHRRRDAGLWQELRARLGRQAHERYALRRATEEPSFLAEQAIELARVVDGFSVSVRGRVDGLVVRGGELVVEELKSMLVPGAQLDRAELETRPHVRDQVLLYALALADRHPHLAIRPTVVLVSVIDGGWTSIDVPFDRESAEKRLRIAVRSAIAQARVAMVRARARRAVASELAFPYPSMRPQQDRLVEAIEDGLRDKRPVIAMAPTGIGKTVSALWPTLRCALSTDATVYFATARTTQQELVVRTFEELARGVGQADHRLLAVTLRAKERMCPPGDLACHPDLCAYLRGFDQRGPKVVASLVARGGHVSPDTIVRAGEAAKLCPFELSLAAAAEADLVVGDYNYVYDREPADSSPGRRARFVILDEAHNLYDRARGYDSPFVSRAAVWQLACELRGQAPQLALPGAGGPAQRVAELLESVAAAIDDALSQSEAEIAGDGCARLVVDEPRWAELAATAEDALVAYMLHKRARRIARPRDPVVSELRGVMRFRELACSHDAALVAYASGTRARQGVGVGVLCVDPARRLARCHAAAAGTIAMSATLHPLRYYIDVLGFRELDPLTVSVPSPFPREHCQVAVVPSVLTTYRHRGAHRRKIAQTIESIIAVRPGNYAAFFSSFAFLEAVARELSCATRAQLVVQTPRMTHAQRDAVLASLRSGRRQTLLLAVLGGIFAEGVDLPGEALVGAIVVGPGLPPVGFEREVMRSYFERTYGDGFAYAAIYPGMQRVVQSAGRVIRSMSDRGVVALLGHRFGEKPYSECLPSEWYASSVLEIVARDPATTFREFWARVEGWSRQAVER